MLLQIVLTIILVVFVVTITAMPNKSSELAIAPVDTHQVKTQTIVKNKEENSETVEQGHVDNYEEFSRPDAAVSPEHLGLKFE